jgi:hypothetical protein
MVKAGTLIDASLVHAAVRTPRDGFAPRESENGESVRLIV